MVICTVPEKAWWVASVNCHAVYCRVGASDEESLEYFINRIGTEKNSKNLVQLGNFKWKYTW